MDSSSPLSEWFSFQVDLMTLLQWITAGIFSHSLEGEEEDRVALAKSHRCVEEEKLAAHGAEQAVGRGWTRGSSEILWSSADIKNI